MKCFNGKSQNLFFIIVVWSTVLPIFIFAQADVASMVYKKYTIEDGLPSNFIFDLTQDNHGYLWIGTDRGLSRFDGHSFKNYSEEWETECKMRNDVIVDIDFGSDGNLYVSGIDGWYKFNPKSECFLNYKLIDNEGSLLRNQRIRKMRLINDSIILVNSGNKILIGDHKGRWTQNILELKQNLQFQNDYDYVRIIGESQLNKNRLYFKYNANLYYFDISTLTLHNPYPQLPVNTGDNFLMELPDSSLFLGGSEKTSYRLKPRSTVWEYIDIESAYEEVGFSGGIIFDGNLQLFGTRGTYKILLENLFSEEPVKYSLDENLKFNVKGSSTVTSEGVLYTNADEGLVKQVNSRQIIRKGTARELGIIDESAQSFKGLTILSNLSNNQILVGDNITRDVYITTLAADQNNVHAPIFPGSKDLIFIASPYNEDHLLMVGNNALYLFNTRDYTHQVWNKPLYDLLNYSGKNFPISYSMGNGKVLIDNQSKLFTSLNDKVQSFNISQVPSQRDNEFFYAKVTPDGQPILVSQFRIIYLSDELKIVDEIAFDKPLHSAIRDVVFQESTVIIATIETGIYIYERATGAGYKVKKHYVNRSQIPDRVIFSIILDKGKSGIWVGCGFGFFHLNLLTDRLFIFGKEEGITNSYFWQPPILFDNGNVLLYDGKLLYEVTNNSIISRIKAPTFEFVKSIESDRLIDGIDKPIKIKQEDRPFQIGLTYIDHLYGKGSSKIQYRIGSQGSWTTLINTNAITVPFLPSGEVIFQTRAANNDGLISSVNELVLDVRPSLLKRSWFLPLTIFILGLLVSLFFLDKNRRKRKRLQELETSRRLVAESELSVLRAQMNPHFMFNSLNSIRNYILNNESELAADYLADFSYLLRLILQYNKTPLISLKEELEVIDLYVSLEQMRFGESFVFHKKININKNLEDIMVPPLITQPFVENAIWHGLLHKDGKRSLEFITSTSDNQLLITIEDNGIGRVRAKSNNSAKYKNKKSMGVEITKQRLNLVSTQYSGKYNLMIDDLYDKNKKPAGTKVSMSFPLINQFDN